MPVTTVQKIRMVMIMVIRRMKASPNGLMATAGGVVFAATREGNLVALDAKTGAHLWHFQTGGNMAASPMSYAVDGRQYVAISAGNVLFSFALPE